MQSHASRHVVSEFLKDLHPDLSPPFPKDVIKDEIAVAYGRRSITKLIDVLALDETQLSDEDRAHALRVFNGLLSTQEHKTDAIRRGAPAPLTKLVRESQDWEVRRNSCEALASLALVLPGRAAIAEADGMASLTGALLTAPEAAARALRHFSGASDGLKLLNQVLDLVVPALADLIMRPKEDGVSIKACENAVAALAGIATSEIGCHSCLRYKVPRAVVSLIKRGISGDFKFEPTLMDCFEQCASCLDQVAHHPLGKTAVREAEGIQVLGKMLPLCTWHPSALLKTTSALMGCSVEKECKLDVMRYAGFEMITLLRNSKDDRVVCNAREMLKSSAEHLEARACLTSMLTERQQVEFIFKGPLPPSPPDFRYALKNV